LSGFIQRSEARINLSSSCYPNQASLELDKEINTVLRREISRLYSYMLLSIKTKLKLNKTQKVLMSKHAGIARFTYNWGLATWQDLYLSGLKPNKYILKKFFNNHVKPELTWIKEKGICQKITQYAFENLGTAFDNFFKGKSQYPQFKKKGRNDSFTIDAGGKPISVGGTRLKLPTIDRVKFKRDGI
jgi:putative transposase